MFGGTHWWQMQTEREAAWCAFGYVMAVFVLPAIEQWARRD